MWKYQSTITIVVAAGLVACHDLSSILPAGPGAESKDTGAGDTGSKDTGSKDAVPDGRGSNTEGFKREPPRTTVAAVATVDAFWTTDLYAKNAGYVTRINSDIGDRVTKGQVLAVIEDPELQAQSDKAMAAVGQAEAMLEVAQREVAGLEADLALQRVTLERQKVLFAGKAATAQMLDEALAREAVASAEVETGKAKVHQAEADLEAARAESSRLETLLGYNKIIAPFDGVVTRRLLNPGDLVQAATSTRTTPLFTCQKVDVLRVFAFIPESSVSEVHVGTHAEVRLFNAQAQAPVVTGNVTRVAGALDPSTRTMRVEVDLQNSDRRLYPGAYARVTFTLEPSKQASGEATRPAASEPPSSQPPSSKTSSSKTRRRPFSIIDSGGTKRETSVPPDGAAARSPDHG